MFGRRVGLMDSRRLVAWMSLQGPVLMQFPQLGDDSIAVIWTMVERHDADSPRAPFWQSLPQQLHSGLSMSESLLQTLQGTPAYAEIDTSRKVYTSVRCVASCTLSIWETSLILLIACQKL